eukprot:1408262-Pyramimonas_sp.AAC.1
MPRKTPTLDSPWLARVGAAGSAEKPRCDARWHDAEPLALQGPPARCPIGPRRASNDISDVP